MEDFPDQYDSEVQITMRIQTFFQNNSFIRNDIDKHFDNKTRRLSRCESISFPTLEILDKAIPKESGHYWLLVLNIRDKRFEVVDSARTLKDKAFLATANKIIKEIKANWERHYASSNVQIKDWELQEIKCPKQDNGRMMVGGKRGSWTLLGSRTRTIQGMVTTKSMSMSLEKMWIWTTTTLRPSKRRKRRRSGPRELITTTKARPTLGAAPTAPPSQSQSPATSFTF